MWHHHRGHVDVKKKDGWFDGIRCGAVKVVPNYP
jgi:hypothetical protein